MSIEVRHLTHCYSAGSPLSTVALDDVSLTIEDHEFVGIVGHTGSGKSTLVQHLNGLLKPTSGQVLMSSPEFSLPSGPKDQTPTEYDFALPEMVTASA